MITYSNKSEVDFTLRAQTLGEYLATLANAQPTPGGGAAAALTAAQGTALLSMVCQLTIGKKKFADREIAAKSILNKLEQYQQLLLELAQQDTDVFQIVIMAYQMPKHTELELAVRTEKIQSALKAAAEIPFKLLSTCADILPLADALETIGNPAVYSDVVVGRCLIYAGLISGRANVEANLSAITDMQFCQAKRDAIRQILTEHREGFLALWHN